MSMTRFAEGDESVAVTATLGTTEVIPMQDFAGGGVVIPSGSSITSLTFYACTTADGTFTACYDDTPTTPVAIALTGLSAERNYPFPAKLFPWPFLKMVGNASGTVLVSRKS